MLHERELQIMTSATGTATSTAPTPPSRRRIAGHYSRDSFYFMLFIIMVAYHLFSNHSALMLAPSAPRENDAEVSFLVPPLSSPTTATGTSTRGESLTIPLDILTLSNISKCESGLTYLPNKILNRSPSNATVVSSKQSTKRQGVYSRKIPKIVHMTSKSRCFASNFVENIKTWEFPDHELYIHDDEAVDRLLSKHWPSFPHIPIARKCLRSGAGMADLWRYLALWEYGGIYTDIDNAPGKFWTSDTIKDDDDAFFVIEKLGVLSQYFIAASPKHPLMYLAVHLSLNRLLDLDHVGKQNIPVVTGPGALKVAFKYFMRTQEILNPEAEREWKANNPNATRHGRVTSGKYYGVGNRSVSVVGTKGTASRWVVRGSVYGKGGGYKKMGMKHFSAIAKKKFNESCLVHLWNLEYGFDSHTGAKINLTNW